MEKRILLIISDQPIKRPKDLKGVQHLIQETLPLKEGSHGGVAIEKSVPQHMLSGSQYPIWGEGPHVSGAITDWLRNLVNVMDYQPYYKKR